MWALGVILLVWIFIALRACGITEALEKSLFLASAPQILIRFISRQDRPAVPDTSQTANQSPTMLKMRSHFHFRICFHACTSS